MTLCPPGSYCPQFPASTGLPIKCPAGYYCPQGSLEPVICFNGTFCPPGSAIYKYCPLGYVGRADANNTLTSIGDACEVCPPGTTGTDPVRLECIECLPGYVCLGATTSATPTDRFIEKGYVCPPGSYCPAGSGNEILCDAGSANPTSGQSNSSVCVLCDEDFYSSISGQAYCKQCSSTSRAVSRGSTHCSCIGLNRAFQTSGLCPCEPGYEWYDTTNFQPRTDNGDVDCQPKVFERCFFDDIRDHTGRCTAENDCSLQCGAESGTRDPTSGLCICDGMQTLAEACDTDCRTESDTIYYDSILDEFVVADASGNLTSIQTLELDGFMGSLSCPDDTCTVVSMTTSGGRFEGNFGAGESLTFTRERKRRLEALGVKDTVASTYRRRWRALEASRTRRWREREGSHEEEYGTGVDANETIWSNNANMDPDRREAAEIFLESSSSSRNLEGEALYPSVAQPVVCINEGDAVLFDVTNEQYPVYDVDSLINSNPGFDYSEFTSLAETAQSTATVSSFLFTFADPGVYVFKMNSNSNSLTIIKVMRSGTVCSTEATFTPMTKSNLNAVKAKLDEDIVLDPDWQVLGGLLGCFAVAVFGIIGAVYFFRKHEWETAGAKSRRKYRERAKRADLKGHISKGVELPRGGKHDVDEETTFVEHAPRSDPSNLTGGTSLSKTSALTATGRRGPPEPDDLLDDLDEEELARQLQRHHDLVEQEFFGQRELVQQLHDAVTHEVDDLKKLLAVSLADQHGIGNATIEALQMLKQEATARRLGDGRCGSAETETFRLVDELQRLLDEGSDRMSRRIVEEVVQATGSAIGASMADTRGGEVASSATAEQITVPESETLIGLRSSVDNLCSLIEVGLGQGSENEARRRRTRLAAWDRFVATHPQLSLPARIIELLAQVQAADETTDRAATKLAGLLASFASHSKHFSRNLSERETALSQELAQTFIDTERASALPEQEQTKRRGITTFTALLDQLRDALLSVFGSSVDVDVLKKRALPASSRLVAEELRIELDNAVEEALANIPRDTLLHEISGQLRSVLDKLDSGVPLALDQLAPIAEFSRNSSLQERQRQDREHKIAEAASKDALEAEVQLDSAQRESAQRLDEGAAIRVENLSSDLTDADRALLQAAVEKDKREAQAALEAERQRQADRVHQITPAPIVESPKIAMEETEAEMLSNRFEELASELSAASEALRLGNVEAIRVVQTRELAALNSRLGAGADSERSALMKELAAKRFERVCGGEVPEAVAKDEALSLQTLQARLRQKSEEERGGAAAAHAEAIANASIDSPLQALIDAHNREKAAIALLEEIIGGHLIPVWKEDVQAELVEMREAINLSDRVDSVESTASLLEMEQLAAECDEFITARGIRLKRTVDKARLEASLRDEERRRRSELDARLAAQQRAIEVDLESAERNLERVKNASDDQREIEDALLAVEASRRDANNFDSNKEMQDLKSRLKQAEMAGRARLDDSMAIERARHHQHLRDRLVARREKAQSRLDATRAAIEEADDEFEHEKLFGTASTEAASEKKLEAAKKAADAAQEVATALILREQDLNRKIADIDEAEVTALRERVENVTKKQTAALAELERSSEVEAERKRARLEQRIAERRDQLASTAQAKRAALEAARIQASMDDHDVGAAARVAQLEQELQDTEKLCASQDDMAEEERRALSKTLLAERDHKGMRLDAQLELERKVANEALRAKLDARRRAAATVAAAKMAISDGSGDKDVNESCEDLSNELNLVDAEIAESDARLTAALLQSRADDEARLAFALGNEAEAKAAAVQRRLKARKQQAELEASLHFAGAKAKIANGESAENEDKAARDATTAAVDIEKQLRDVLKNQDVDETKRLKASEIRSEIEARRDDLAKVLEDECKSREAALRDRLARRRAKYEADVASKESNAKVAAEKALKVREEARRLQDENAPGDLVDAARSAARACESEASIAAEATAHAKLALQTQLEENEAEIERAVKQLREDRDAEISRFERESLAARSKAHEELHSRLDARRRGREARAQAKLRAAEAGTASSTEESKRLFDEASAAVAALCELENEDMEDEKRVMAELSKMEDSQAHRVRSAWESEQDRSRSKLKARLEARLAKAAAKELAAKNEHVQDVEESVQAVHNEARVAAAVLDRQIAEAALNDMDEPSFVSDEDEEERLLAEEIRRGRGRAAALLEARLAADYENEQARLSTQYAEREAELKLEVEKSAEASDTAAELARIASEEASADPESKELSSLALARENAAKTASNAAASAARAKAGLQASREDDKRRLDEDFRDRREEHLAAIEEWFDAEHRRRIDALRAGRALRRKKAEFEALTAEAAALRAAKHTEKLRASGVNDNSDAEAELRKAATEAAIKRMAFDKEFGASDSQKIPYAGHASTVSDDEDEDDDQKSRASMLKAVHMRELQTLESKLADQAAKSRADLESRLEARRKCGMRSTQNSTASLVSALSSPPELGPGADPLAAMGGRVLGSAADAVNELEAKALLEQQLLAERVGALEALLAGQKRDIEIGASAEEVANRVAAKLAEDQHQLSAALEAKKLELAEQKAVEREAMLSGLDEQSRARLMLLDREAADADRSAIAADTAERAAISKMEAARLAALAASRELSARDEAESKRLEALETLRAKHDAQAKALESDMDAERAKRRARLLERRAERTAADPKSKSVEDNDNIELLMTADADETRRAALVAQQKAEHDSAEALFAKIASLEKERSDREAELAHSAEREKLAKRQMLAAKMLSGASRAAELAKIDAEVAARLKEEVSRVESEHADRIESVVQESEATEAAVTAASQQLAKIQDDESVRRAELDESLAKRRDRERKKLKDRLKARSQSSQASLRTSESTAAIPHDDELVEMANLEAKLDQQDLEAIAAAETAAANRYAAVAEAVVQVRNSVDSPPEDAGEAVDAAEKARAHVAELQSRENDDEVANAALKVAEEEARRAEQRASVAMARAAAVEAKRLADERASNAIELVREEAEQDAKKQRKERERRASQAKIAVLKTDAAQEAADVEARLDSARRGQKSKLQRRLEEKRRKQAEKKQAAEKEQAEKRAQVFARQGQTLQTQHSWGTELQSRALELGNDSDVDSVAALVRSALSEGIIPVVDAADAVEFVLRRRHAAESAKQLADQYSERSAKLAESLNALLDEKAQKRADLLSQQCKDEDRQAALEQLESDFFVKQKRAQMEISASLEDTQLAEEAALRRRHMTEVMSVLRTLDVLPARALQSVALKKQEEIAIDGSISNKPSSEAEAEAMLAAAEAAELEALRKRMESEKEERLRQIEEERRTAEESAKQEHAAKIQAIQAEQEAAMAKEREAVAQQLLAEKNKLQADFQANLAAVEAEQNEEVKEKLLQKAQAERIRAEKEIKFHQAERRNALKDRLARRRENKIKQEEAELQVKLRQQEGDANRLKKQVAEETKLTTEMREQEARELHKQLKGSGANVTKWQDAKDHVLGKLRSAFGNDSRRNLAPSSSSSDIQDPLVRLQQQQTVASAGVAGRDLSMVEFREKLDRIELLIGKLTSAQASFEEQQQLNPGGAGNGIGGVPEATVPKLAGQLGSEATFYHDAEDPMPHGPDLVPIAKHRLSPSKLQRLEFAEKLIGCLGLGDKLELEIAESLPENSLTKSAFRNSYRYDESTSVLHVHIKRIGTYGDVALIILHAVSHIKSNELFDDTSPTFIAEFHRNFKVVMQQLVKMEADAEFSTSFERRQQHLLQTKRQGSSSSFDNAERPHHDFGRDALSDRIKAYADASGYPLLSEFMGRYESSATPADVAQKDTV